MEHEATVQHLYSPCRDLPWCKRHPDKSMPTPVPLYPFLESSWVLGRHIGAPAIGGPPSAQRGREGFQRLGLHRCGGPRLCGGGMPWIRGVILGPFGTALRPW